MAGSSLDACVSCVSRVSRVRCMCHVFECMCHVFAHVTRVCHVFTCMCFCMCYASFATVSFVCIITRTTRILCYMRHAYMQCMAARSELPAMSITFQLHVFGSGQPCECVMALCLVGYESTFSLHCISSEIRITWYSN